METMRVVVLNRVRVEGLEAVRKVAAPFPSPSSPAPASPAGVPDGPDLAGERRRDRPEAARPEPQSPRSVGRSPALLIY